jgi:hypothetical protein
VLYRGGSLPCPGRWVSGKKNDLASLFEAEKSLIDCGAGNAEEPAAEEREADRPALVGSDVHERVKDLRLDASFWPCQSARSDVCDELRRLLELVRLEAPEQRVHFINNGAPAWREG